MTCVTLKRPIEVLGSPHMMEHEPMAKRKRCGASFFPTTPPGSRFGRSGLGSPSSPFSGSVGGHGAMNRSAKRAKRRLEIDDRDSLPGADSPPPVSSFLNATPVLSPGKALSQYLVREINYTIGDTSFILKLTRVYMYMYCGNLTQSVVYTVITSNYFNLVLDRAHHPL